MIAKASTNIAVDLEALVARVRAAASGDRAAFERLYRDHAPTVRALAMARVPPDVAEDVVHDVFVTAMQRLPELRDAAAFRAWLLQIARRRVADHHRRPVRRASVEPAAFAASPDRLHSERAPERGSDPPVPSTTPPERQPPAAPATRDPGALRRAIQRQAATLDDDCLPADETDTVRIELRLRIAPAGAVDRATASARPTGHGPVARCVERRARAWRFEPAREPTSLTLPIVLAARR